MAKNNTIIISGPTATGKTGLAIEVAQRLNGCIVNFDSLLFYNELTIGTAKPSPNELALVPHYMVNCSSIKSPLNAADYCQLAHPIIADLHQQNKTVILVGGSGFYLRALVNGMHESITTPAEIIEKSNQLYQSQGITPFIEILKNHDPHNFERLHANDHYRIRRAVEHWWSTGKPFSEALSNDNAFDHALADQLGWNLIHIHLDIPKPEHWEIILNRTRQMIQLGLINEVEQLLKIGFTGKEKPLLSIGYKETQEYLRSPERNIDQLIENIAIATRQLAKAQRTWFNKIEAKKKFNPLTQKEEIWQTINQFLKT